MKVAVIGLGRFGKLLVDILKEQHELIITSNKIIEIPGTTWVPREEALKADTIFYCTPIGTFEDVIKSDYKSYKPGTLIIDVLSVKVHPRNIFNKYLPENVTAILTHPMFGPDSVKETGLKNARIVVDRFTATKEQSDYWVNFFKSKELDLIEMSAEEHDKYAAKSQGITHYIGRVLDQVGLEPSPIDTLGAIKLLEIKSQTCNDSWQLFNDLQTYNPFTIDVRLKLGEAVENIYNKLLPNRVNNEKLIFGIQGGKGSFNEEAATYLLNRNHINNYDLVYLYTTPKVLDALHAGKVDRGLFAIHNSIGGIVQESVDAMAKYKFKIIEQFSILIEHNLFIHPEAEFSNVDTIMTHPQVISQCKTTLSEKYPRLKLTSGEGDLVDSAYAAKHLSEDLLPRTTAVMGSKVFADAFGLKLVESNLQDLKQNYTMFLFVERM